MLWFSWLLGVVAGAGAVVMVGRRKPRTRTGRGECACCGYSLTGLDAVAGCPECGASASQREQRAARNAFWRKPAAFGLPALALIALVSPLLGLLDWGAMLIGTAPTAAPFALLAIIANQLATRMTVPELIGAVGGGSLAGTGMLLFAYIGTFYIWPPDGQSGLVLFFGPIVAAGCIGLGFAAGLTLGTLISRKR